MKVWQSIAIALIMFFTLTAETCRYKGSDTQISSGGGNIDAVITDDDVVIAGDDNDSNADVETTTTNGIPVDGGINGAAITLGTDPCAGLSAETCAARTGGDQ